MNRRFAIAAMLLAASFALQAADIDPAERARVLGVARTVIADAGFATLITVAEDGQPQARIMDPGAPDEQFVVWMATKSASRKVSQIRKNPRATLHYFDRSTMSYVTLLGTASIVADPAEKERRWKAEWAPFYPGGAKDEELLLIRFEPRTIEVVSVPNKVINDSATWLPVTVQMK